MANARWLTLPTTWRHELGFVGLGVAGLAVVGLAAAGLDVAGLDPNKAAPVSPTTLAQVGLSNQDQAAQAIQADLAALGLTHEAVDPAIVNKLLAYLHLLQKWNSAYNLTAIRDPHAMRVQHLADCLAVVQPLRKRASALHQRASTLHQQPTTALNLDAVTEADSLEPASTTPLRILDVGSGGGLPGVILALLNPGWQVQCIDAVSKKAAFVRQVAGELNLSNLQATHGRVEALLTTKPAAGTTQAGHFDVVIARAFSSLADLVAGTQNVLAPTGLWAAMKGRDPDEEKQALPPQVQVLAVEKLAVPGLDAQRCIVWMSLK
jgi:16S rRNA (guanine527-N7)-methyltransferase